MVFCNIVNLTITLTSNIMLLLVSGFLADCNENYNNNTNLHVMMLPPSCRTVTVNPRSNFSLSDSDQWDSMDLRHTFTASKLTYYAIVMYQYSGYRNYNYVVMCLNIDSAPQPHSVSLCGRNALHRKLWIVTRSTWHRRPHNNSRVLFTHPVCQYNLNWSNVYIHSVWQNRALTVITC